MVVKGMGPRQAMGVHQLRHQGIALLFAHLIAQWLGDIEPVGLVGVLGTDRLFDFPCDFGHLRLVCHGPAMRGRCRCGKRFQQTHLCMQRYQKASIAKSSGKLKVGGFGPGQIGQIRKAPARQSTEHQ